MYVRTLQLLRASFTSSNVLSEVFVKMLQYMYATSSPAWAFELSPEIHDWLIRKTIFLHAQIVGINQMDPSSILMCPYELAAMFEISDMRLRETSHVHQVSSSHNNQTLQQTHQRFPNTKLLQTKHYNSSTLHMFQCLQHSHFVASWLGKIKIPAHSLLMDSNCQEALQNKNLTKPGQSIWIKKWRICCCTILFTNAMNRQ